LSELSQQLEAPTRRDTMKKVLVLSAVLALALAGCKMMEPRPPLPPEGGECSAPGGPAPKPPPAQSIPDVGPVPSLPKSTNIVVGLCLATGRYEALGVDTQTRQFTFMYRGGRATQAAAFSRFYEARVPVAVYTSPVRLTARGAVPATGSMSAPAPAPAPAPATGPAPLPTPPPEEGSRDPESGPLYDPCETISEEAPPSPKPAGSVKDPTILSSFQSLSWYTANALDAVSDPVAPSTAPGTAPGTVPGTAPVPQ
jgi:hypothetical protein